MRVDGYPRIKIHQPALASHKIVLTWTHDSIFPKCSTGPASRRVKRVRARGWSNGSGPVAGQTGQGPRRVKRGRARGGSNGGRARGGSNGQGPRTMIQIPRPTLKVLLFIFTITKITFSKILFSLTGQRLLHHCFLDIYNK